MIPNECDGCKSLSGDGKFCYAVMDYISNIKDCELYRDDRSA